ncbi:MAG: hypothetical protein GC189_02375 [Alphaproteobacteria bacterium]|nr:hypothetical protein [Alphaproteobacteria bacterium]
MFLLDEKSGLTRADGETGAHAAGPIAVSRALCRFKPFFAPPGLSDGDVRRAARVFADSDPDLAGPETVLVHTAYGAAAWRIEREKTPDLTPAQMRMAVPEALLREAADGWVVARCIDGYDAQFWRDGALRAASWRRAPFTEAAWASFVLSVDDDAATAPAAPPEPIELPFSRTKSWRKGLIARPWTWRSAETALHTLALAGLVVAVFFAAAAARQSSTAQRAESALAAMTQQDAQDSAFRARRGVEQAARAFALAAPPSRAPAALADALETLDRFAPPPESWRITEETFTAQLTIQGSEIELQELLSALNASPALCGAAPDLSPHDGLLTIRAFVQGTDEADACAAAARATRL